MDFNEALPTRAPCERVQGVKAKHLHEVFLFMLDFFLAHLYFDLFVHFLINTRNNLGVFFYKKNRIKKSIKWKTNIHLEEKH